MAGIQLITVLLWAVISTVQGVSHQGNCPDIQLPNNSSGTCVLSEKCSKVTCTSPEGDDSPAGPMVLTVQVKKCLNKLKASVSMESLGQRWSNVFEDGDKAKLPTPPGGLPGPTPYLKVNLKENGGKVHFKLLMLMESPANLNVTFLEGELHPLECIVDKGGEGGSMHTKQCPAVKFIPEEPDAGKCFFSQKCSKLKCVAEAGGHKLTAGLKVSRCGKSLVASVKLQQPEVDLDWFERLKDGEKAKLPIKASSFSGGLAVSDAKLYVQVQLKEIQDNKVNFTVTLVGHVTALGETTSVNTVLIQGQIFVSSVADCGSWFSEQSTAVKVLVILVPLTAGILVALTVAFCCCKRGRDGTRLYVNIFKSRNDGFGMRRLSNDI